MPWLSLLAEVLAIVLSAVILGAVAWLRRSLAAPRITAESTMASTSASSDNQGI